MCGVEEFVTDRRMDHSLFRLIQSGSLSLKLNRPVFGFVFTGILHAYRVKLAKKGFASHVNQLCGAASLLRNSPLAGKRAIPDNLSLQCYAFRLGHCTHGENAQFNHRVLKEFDYTVIIVDDAWMESKRAV